MTNILITGAGSVMGQSIFKALSIMDNAKNFKIHFSNSDEYGAGLYFNFDKLKVFKTVNVPLATNPSYQDFINDYIIKNKIDIVYPGTQHELIKLSELKDSLNNIACLPQNITKIALDKFNLNEVLVTYDIDVPKQSLLSNFIENRSVNTPLIVKPITNSASRNLRYAYLENEVDNLIESIKAEIPETSWNEYVVQELLDGEEYTCGCYVDKYSKKFSTIVMKRTLTLDGASGYGQVVKNSAIENYLLKVNIALHQLGLDFGNFNVQLKLTSRGPVLFEINPRLSSTEAPKAKLGFNSCAAFFHNIVEKKSYDQFQPKFDGSFLRYYEEVYF